MRNWIKKFLGIDILEHRIDLLRSEIRSKDADIQAALDELKTYRRLDADVGFRGNNTIILTGIYRNKGYVRFYDVGNGEFKYLAERLKDMQKTALIRNIDEPPSFNFKGAFDL